MQKPTSHQAVINNEFYDELQERWYTANDHPIALLRHENTVRVPWIQQEIKNRIMHPAKVLDIGCGAGFLTNQLAKDNHIITGIDLSPSSLEIARKHDQTKKVSYIQANAYDLAFEDQSFDVVCAMDILEHVHEPQKIIAQASRLLKKDGLFFFHTFNRTLLSYLLIIKGAEWCVPNTPPNIHIRALHHATRASNNV